MNRGNRLTSLVAERAVRYVRDNGGSASSIELVRRVMSTRAPDEATATRVLETAFAGDSRLVYVDHVWRESDSEEPGEEARPGRSAGEVPSEPDRALLFVEGLPRTRSEPFRLTSVSALRLQGDLVVGACGGDATPGPPSDLLRRSVLKTLSGAVPVIHDPPGSVPALERWLGESLPPAISLRRLAQERLGMTRRHDLEALVAKLGMPWREGGDLVEIAETLDACLARLRRPGERLRDLQLRQGERPDPIDWSRYAFDADFLGRVPAVPGTYRFYDDSGRLIYVGKSKNLSQRLTSYFRETGRARSPRVRRLLAALHSIEYTASGSDLEAMLREAEQIRRDRPSDNVQRRVHFRQGRAARLLSILVLEPAEAPAVLRAYLIRDARLVGRVRIGPRGGGLRRIERILDDYFFFSPSGPTTVPGPGLDVEVVARWLSANRERVVAFDPTDLGGSREVVERLRWFLQRGTALGSDGLPIVPR